MNIPAMLKNFCDAVERRDGKAFAKLFTEDGVYHDVFYGAFKGRAEIAEMIDDWFYRTASDFRDRGDDTRNVLRPRQPMVAVLDDGQHHVVGRQPMRQLKRMLPGHIRILRSL